MVSNFMINGSRTRTWRLPRLIPAVLCLLCLTQLASAGFNTVVIDAGHGGHDRGGVPGQRYPEKVFTLDVAKRLERILRRAGFKTVMTRTRDEFVPLSNRTQIANRYRNSIFVSIHFNSAKRVGARGFETFYYQGAESYQLAQRIQRNIMMVARTENRGVKRRGFYVLRHTKNPAVLVECGFLTNPYEARMCVKRSFRDKMAKRIARGIMEQHFAVRGRARSLDKD